MNITSPWYKILKKVSQLTLKVSASSVLPRHHPSRFGLPALESLEARVQSQLDLLQEENREKIRNSSDSSLPLVPGSLAI